jgi:hypothetical protein
MDDNPARLRRAHELLATDIPPRDLLLDPLISTQTLALLYGPRGLGKTFFALGMAWAVASGESFLGWRGRGRCRVVYLDGEMAAVDIQKRIAMFGPSPDTLEFLVADLERTGSVPDLGTSHGQRHLLALCDVFPDLLVIDNLASLCGFSTRDPDPWRKLERFLLMLRRIKTAVLIVHHANKQGLQRGTSRREDLVDLVMAIRRPADYRPSEGARFELHFEKTRALHGHAIDPIEARLAVDADGRAQWSWNKAEAHEAGRVAALLRAGLNPNQIARELGISKSKAYRLREQVTSGTLT